MAIRRRILLSLMSAPQTDSPILNNKIWYTSSDGNVVTPHYTNVFGANIISNTYTDGVGVITFDGDVTTIGNYTFSNCNLTSVTIPDSVTTIGYAAFNNCNRLTSITIGKGVTTIGDYAVTSCESLTSVYCKATTPPSLGYAVFDSNGSGRKIYVPAASVDAYKSASGWSAYASDIVGYDGEENLITFYIDSPNPEVEVLERKANSGMTWGQWVQSDFNLMYENIEYNGVSEQYFEIISNDIQHYSEGWRVARMNDGIIQLVKPTDIIEENFIYICGDN